MELDLFEKELAGGGRSGLSQLQSRYVIPFAVGVFAAILIVGVVLSLRSRDLLREQVSKEQLSSARAGAQALSNNAETVLRMLDSIAKSDIVDGTSYNSIKSYLQHSVDNLPIAESIFLFNTQAKLITGANANSDIALKIADDPCFDKVRAGSMSCFSRMFRNEDKRRNYVFVPVFNDTGVLTRIIAGGIDLEDKAFQSIVLGINPGNDGFSYLVDRTGNLVISGDTDKERAKMDVSDLQAVKDVLDGRMGSDNYKYGRTVMTVSFSPVEPLGWGFIVQRPASESGAGAGALYKLVFFFLIIGTAGAAVLALFQAQIITRFLFMLSNRMDSIASGKKGQHISSDENCGLERITDSFNTMVEMIEKDWARGNAELEDVKKTAQFNAGVLSSIQDLFLVATPSLKVMLINDKAEVYVPANSRSAISKPMSELGHAWSQRRLREAASKAMETGEVSSISNIRFTTPDGADTAIFDFRIYPVTGDNAGVFFYGREISEFAARHEKLQNSEQFFRELATDLGDALVVVDHLNRVEWYNPVASRMLNIDDDFIEQNWMDIVKEKSRDTMKALLENAADDGTPQLPDEIDIEWRDHTMRIELTVGKMVFVGSPPKFVFTFRSVPAARAMEREAYKNKGRLENKIKFLTAVLDSIPDVIAVTGNDGRLKIVNRAFCEMFKSRREVLIGKKMDTLHNAAGPLVDMSAVARDGLAQRETMLRNYKGDAFKASVVCSSIQNGTQSGYILSLRETETEHRNKVFEKRVLESRARTSMARTVAGKFESTIDNLGVSLKELGGNIFADDTRSLWANSIKHCKDLTMAVNSLHMYAIESNVSLVACNVGDVIEDTITELKSRGVVPPDVAVDIDCRECPPLNADPDHLKMILWHLAKNAVEAASENPDGGSILLRAYPADIESSQVVVAEVLDNGPDYNPAKTEHFFDPFNGTKPGGIGLGLTLARRAVMKHNGRIGILRSDNVTRASFYIPLYLTPKHVMKSEDAVPAKV